jgi:hypothetical protein
MLEDKGMPKPRVLVVEDDEINQLLLLELLDMIGCDSVGATNGEEAFAELENISVDLILMDIQMPALNGITAAEIIRAVDDRLVRDIPIVAITGDRDPARADECRQAGMNTVLYKPITLTAIQTLLTDYGLMPAAAHAPTSVSTPSIVDGFDYAALVDSFSGRQDKVEGVLALFCKEAPAQLEAIKECCAFEDYTAARKAVHRLKGVSANVHAWAMSELCAEIEDKLIAQDPWEALAPLLQGLEDALGKISAAFHCAEHRAQ